MLNKALTPSFIVKYLDQYVIGQDEAKKTVAVTVYSHFKKIAKSQQDGAPIAKSNVLLIGPSGTGKTLLCETLSGVLGVPFVTAEATALAQSRYVNEEIEAVLQRLVDKAGGDVAKSQHEFRIGAGGARGVAKASDNRLGCSGRREQPGPLEEHRVVPRFGQGRNIGKRGKPLVAPRSEHPQLAGLDVLNDRRRAGSDGVDVAAEKSYHRRSGTGVRYVQHLDAGAAGEHFHRHVHVRRAAARWTAESRAGRTRS